MKQIEWNEGWRFEGEPVTLPHDAMIHSARHADAGTASGGGYFEGGKYIYEKSFTPPESWKDQELLLEFEGVYRNAKVFVNDTLAGGRPYGYIPFYVSLTPHLIPGAENTVRVEADNTEVPNSRWYSGGGIYRPVHLHIGPKSHILPDGIRVTTLSTHPARIRIDVSHTGSDDAQILTEIFDGEEFIVSAAGNSAECAVPDAKLWSAETPHLYRCRVTLEDGGSFDTAETSFGIRTLSWSTKGFFVNGKSTLLRGGCLHHDNGVLGACTYREAEERKVRILKENGYNAIRSAHNPCSKALLDACDRYGIYLMDEMWDTWYYKKNPYDYGRDFPDNYKEDIASLVTRDYSHPSVVLYSIGNEVSEPSQEKGVALAQELVRLFHQDDPTRPVTAGINLMILAGALNGGGIYKQEDESDGSEKPKEEKPKTQPKMNSTLFNLITSMVGGNMNKVAASKKVDRISTPVLDLLDIAGYNYASGRYPLDAKEHPERIVVGSETFPQDIAKNWAMVKKYPYLIGDFCWTCWDYLGETGIGTWSYEQDATGFSKPFPWLLADTGAFDILGNPTAEAFRAKAVWEKDTRPLIAVHPFGPRGASIKKSVWRGSDGIPSWSWKGHEGENTTVEVFSSAYKIGLLLNGKLIGLKKVKDSRAAFTLTYQPGVLKAVALDRFGNIIGRTKLLTASDPAAALCPEKKTAAPGEVVFVPIRIQDADGNLEASFDQQLWLSVKGGTLLGMGSACPRTTDRYDTGCCRSWHGCALAVIRAGKTGEISMTLKTAYGKTSCQIPIEN